MSRPPSTSTIPSRRSAKTSGKAGPGIGVPFVQAPVAGSYTAVSFEGCPQAGSPRRCRAVHPPAGSQRCLRSVRGVLSPWSSCRLSRRPPGSRTWRRTRANRRRRASRRKVRPAAEGAADDLEAERGEREGGRRNQHREELVAQRVQAHVGKQLAQLGRVGEVEPG